MKKKKRKSKKKKIYWAFTMCGTESDIKKYQIVSALQKFTM